MNLANSRSFFNESAPKLAYIQKHAAHLIAAWGTRKVSRVCWSFGGDNATGAKVGDRLRASVISFRQSIC